MSGDMNEVFRLGVEGQRLLDRAAQLETKEDAARRNLDAVRQERETVQRQAAEVFARIDAMMGNGPQLRLTVSEPASAPKRKPKPRVKRDNKLRHKALLVMWAVSGQRCSKRELCDRIGRTMSTQGGALSNMRRDGLIDYDRKGEHANRWAWLTDKGRSTVYPLLAEIRREVSRATDAHRAIIDLGYAADRKNAGLILKRLGEQAAA